MYIIEYEKIGYLQELLKEYYNQSMEDCRVIGNQKYSVLVAIAVAAGTFLYAVTNISEDLIKNPYLLALGFVAVIIILFSIHSFVFLTLHLSCMVNVTKNIEQLQMDLAFKEIEINNCSSNTPASFKIENTELFLSDINLSERFKDITPHIAVYKPSKVANIQALILVVLALIVIIYFIKCYIIEY